MRFKAPFILALLFGIGLLSGTAVGTPLFTPGGQTALPVAQPLPAVYAFPVNVMPTDIIQDVHLGRDDTMFFASVNVLFAVAAPPPGTNPRLLTYRPLWDQQLFPSPPPSPVAGPIPSFADFHAQWMACDAFARAMRDLREASRFSRPSSLMCFLDPAGFGNPSPQLNSYEFYKFEVTY